MKRPIESKDVVRIRTRCTKSVYENTGVVHKICSTTGMINVFVTKNNPYGIGIWFFPKDLKRIGRVK